MLFSFLFFLFLSFVLKIFILYYFNKRQIYREEKLRDFYLLVQPPNGYNVQSCANLKPGASQELSLDLPLQKMGLRT